MYFDKGSLRKRGLIWKGTHLPYNPQLIKKARVLRKNMTPSEKKLWFNYLRRFPFRVLRQRPIDNYIVDFYCHELKLVIEIDGKHHYIKKNIEYDNERTEILYAYGLKVIRIKNSDVLYNFENVCRKIDDFLIEREELSVM